MSNIQLDYSDITDIFKEKLKIENIVKKVSSIFLNQRYSGKINYKPYFQRMALYFVLFHRVNLILQFAVTAHDLSHHAV